MLGVGQVDFSLDLLISLKVPKSNRSEDPFSFQFTSLCSMCRNVGNSSVCTQSTCEFTLCNNSQFSLKTLRKQAYFCQKFVFISCPIQMLLSCTKLYEILELSRDSRLQATGYFPTARESYDGLRLQSGKFCHCCAGP